MAGISLSDATAQASLVALGISIARPFLERYVPFAAAGASTHDATLRALNVVVNLLAVVGSAAASGQFNTSQWFVYVLAAAAQAAGSHTLYQMVKAPAVAAAAASQAAPPLDAAASTALAAQVHGAVANSLAAPVQ